MPDREKVINDLQDAVNDDWMWQHADYYAKAMENAIALLKEQDEPKQIVRKQCKKEYEDGLIALSMMSYPYSTTNPRPFVT